MKYDNLTYFLTPENLTLLLLNENKKGPNFSYHLYSITWKHLNINECMINLKTLNYSSAFHSLSLEKIWLPLGTKLEAKINGLTIPRTGTEDTVKEAVGRTQVRLVVLRTQSSKSDLCRRMKRLREIPSW